MKPTVTISLSDYNNLIALRDNQIKIYDNNLIKIFLQYSHYSTFEGLEGRQKYQISYDYYLDRGLPEAFIDEFNKHIQRIHTLINEQNQAANLLQAEREQQKKVPKWIVRLFNRKAN